MLTLDIAADKGVFKPKIIDIILIAPQNVFCVICGYSLELSHRGTSNKYPYNLCFHGKIGKIFMSVLPLSRAMNTDEKNVILETERKWHYHGDDFSLTCKASQDLHGNGVLSLVYVQYENSSTFFLPYGNFLEMSYKRNWIEIAAAWSRNVISFSLLTHREICKQ